MIFLPNRRGKFKVLDLQGDPPPPHQFSLLVRYPDLPIRKILRVVGLLTVMIFFQNRKFTACKINDEKEETIFYFLMVFNLLKIIHPIESKNHFGHKVCVRYFLANFYFSPNNSPSKTMKDIFHLKSSFGSRDT